LIQPREWRLAWTLFGVYVVYLLLAVTTMARAQAPTPELKLCRVTYLLPTKSGTYYAEVRPADKRMRPCLFSFAGATEP
jgi:hypothetical protein